MRRWAFLIGITAATATFSFAQPTRPSSADSGAATRPVGNDAQEPLPADQMLSQMLRPTKSPEHALPAGPATPAIDAKSGSGALAPSAEAMTVLREGTDIVNRVCRLQKSDDGQQSELMFDSDGKTMHDPPLVVLPNLTLMRMESAVQSASHDLRFRITGVVTEYHGRNYILLDKAVVVDDKSQQF
jgi:hypothetical protein